MDNGVHHVVFKDNLLRGADEKVKNCEHAKVLNESPLDRKPKAWLVKYSLRRISNSDVKDKLVQVRLLVVPKV